MSYFKFNKVGQGLFYYGVLDSGYTFIYDCGTSTGGVDVKTMIDDLCAKSNGRLDFLAISHFHKDHISEIDYIKSKFRSFKLFVPYLSESSKNVTYFLLFFNFFGDFLLNNKTSTFANFDEINADFFLNFVNNYYLKSESAEVFKKENKTSINDKNWIFYFFNKTLKKKKEELLELILTNINVEQLIIDKKFDELIKIYNAVFGSKLNDSSLILLHYPIDYNRHILDCCGETCKRPFSLLTGDINFSSSLAKQVINCMPFGARGIAQIPHHGAKKEFESFFKRFKSFDYYVVSYGTNNIYGHPDCAVFSSICATNLVEVNENIDFDYRI